MPTTTYKKIAVVEVGAAGAANIQFTSIPGTYTDLFIFTSLRTAKADFNEIVTLTLNGSPTYSWRRLRADTGTVDSSSGSNNQYYRANAASSTSSTFANTSIYIPNYTSSNNKSLSIDSAVETNTTAYDELYLVAGLATLTTAITSITLAPFGANNFVQYSKATLYGIA